MNGRWRDEYDDERLVDCGPCCVCGRPFDATVSTLLLLDFEAPPGTVGWGCLVCHLPLRGAAAIVCDACCALHGERTVDHLVWIMGGRYARDGVRVPLDGFEREPFEHRAGLHDNEGEPLGADFTPPRSAFYE